MRRVIEQCILGYFLVQTTDRFAVFAQDEASHKPSDHNSFRRDSDSTFELGEVGNQGCQGLRS